MARPQTSAYAPILAAVRDRLLGDDCLGPDAYVEVSLTPRDAYNLETRYVSVRPSGVMTVPADGGGRHYKRLRRLLHVTACTRVGVDAAGEEGAALTDAEQGHLYLEEVIVDALELWTPRDADGVNLLYEPMRLVEESGDAERDPDLARDVIRSTLVFETRYAAPFA